MCEDIIAAFGIGSSVADGLHLGGTAPLEVELLGEGVGRCVQVHLHAGPSSSYCRSFHALNFGAALSLTP